jgi:ribokinase
MNYNRVAVVGSSNTDMVVKTSRFPNPGETLIGGEFFVFPGGKGANQAVAAARMGAEVRLICAVGTDSFGEQAIAGYEKEGIVTDAIEKVNGFASGIALITVNAQGENEIVVAPGANDRLLPTHLNENLTVLQESDIILAQLEIPLETIGFLAAFSQSENIPFILNPAPAKDLETLILNNLFAITPNQTEAELLTGIKIDSISAARQSAKTLKSRGVKNVVITLGKEGVYYLGEEGDFHLPASKVKAIDSTAAGDVFNGVLAAGLAKGLSWKESIKRSNKAAALSVTRMGAQNSAPYEFEI